MLTYSPASPTEPAVNPDKTLTGIVNGPVRQFPGYGLLTVKLPASQTPELAAGRYFLARCGAQSEFERLHQWHYYARQPLFAAGVRLVPAPHSQHAAADSSGPVEQWELLIPSARGVTADPGLQWLQGLKPGAALNLLGPFGQGFTLHPNGRRLLLVANLWQVATLFTLIEPMLDSGGHVTLLVDASPQPHAAIDPADVVTSLIPQLPIAVEAHVAASAAELEQELANAIPWADQICAALHPRQHQLLADLIRKHRFRLDDGFAQALVQADLLCGVGACLACVIALPSGAHTRACIHGPVMDLTRLTL
ncbi:MAG: hypothetical protein R3A44_45200 [Caldilineaceae bacterium]